MARIFILMAGLTALFGVLGNLLGGQQGMILFLGIALVMNFASYWFSGPMVLKMYKARKVTREDAPDLYDMVDRLRQKAGLPMPTLAIAPSEQPNAFATGRNYEHAVVCFTAGLLQLMSREEIEGVAAHELAHIQHRHMLVGTIAASMAGAVAMLASVARWGAILGGGRDDRNPFALIAMSIVAPMAAMIIQFAISRQNEFQADATAARLTGNPLGLANGLRRLESMARRIPMNVNPAAAQLAIVNPLAGGTGAAFSRLFSTHPPTEQRIQRLEALTAGGQR